MTYINTIQGEFMQENEFITEFNDPTLSVIARNNKVKEGASEPYIIYDISALNLPADTTSGDLSFKLNAKHETNNYDKTIEISRDGGKSWEALDESNVLKDVKFDQISTIKARVRVIDDNGELENNQNEGEMTQNLSTLGAIKFYGTYENELSLEVKADGFISALANASVVDNDHNVYLDGTIREKGYEINLDDGDDTLTIAAGAQKSVIDTKAGNDMIVFGDGAYMEGLREDDKEAVNVKMGDGDDTFKMNVGSAIFHAGVDLGDADANGKNEDKLELNSVVGVINSSFTSGSGDDKFNVSEGSNINGVVFDTKGGNDTVNISSGTVANGLLVKTGEGKDFVNFENSKFQNSAVESGSGDDVVLIDHSNVSSNDNSSSYIASGDGDDLIKIYGSTYIKSKIYAGEGDDRVYIGGSGVDEVDIDLANGADKVEVVASHFANSKLDLGWGGEKKMSVVENSDINGVLVRSGEANDSISVKDSSLINSAFELANGDDKVVLENVKYSSNDAASSYIAAENGNDSVTISNDSILERINFYMGDGNDGVNLSSSHILNSNIYLGSGYDIFNATNSSVRDTLIESGDGFTTIGFSGSNVENSTIVTGKDDDTIVLDRGEISGSKIFTQDGSDGVVVGSNLTKSVINTGKDSDALSVADGVNLKDTYISTGDDNDSVSIGKGVILEGSHINGGDGVDKLFISEAIDFSKVSGFEVLDLTTSKPEGNGLTLNHISLDLNLADVLHITGNNLDTVLRINGDKDEFGKGDSITLHDFTKGESNDGYTLYTSNQSTVSIEIKDQIDTVIA